MSRGKLYDPGDNILVRVQAGTGAWTEQPGKVKEMAGQNNVAITVHGKDRIVPVSKVRKDPNWTKSAAPPALTATIGEQTVAKITPPRHFEPKDAPKTIARLMKEERTGRTVTLELMARMLRIKSDELAQFEAGEAVPSDDVVLRMADVLDIDLDPLIAGQAYSRAEAQKKTEAEALKRAEREAEERAAAAPTPVESNDQRTFEAFGERLMDICAVPIDRERRKQWYVFARALFELERSA